MKSHVGLIYIPDTYSCEFCNERVVKISCLKSCVLLVHCLSLISMWWTFWKDFKFEGLCLVNTLLSCEVCDEQFEKKSELKGCVWSIHCCPVKYVMNSLKRNFVWRVVFGQYIVVLWSMWWTVWKEIWFNESYAVSPFNC